MKTCEDWLWQVISGNDKWRLGEMRGDGWQQVWKRMEKKGIKKKKTKEEFPGDQKRMEEITGDDRRWFEITRKDNRRLENTEDKI